MLGNGGQKESGQASTPTQEMVVPAVRVISNVVRIVASIDKIRQTLAFAQLTYNYQVLPDAFINLSALSLP
jgi:hypothetical protein